MADTYEIAPLEAIVAPAELDGRSGRFRMEQGPFATDLQAVQEWVAAADSAATEWARRGLGEKLLNWAYAVRGSPLSSFDWDEFNAFFRFLAAPEPREAWCSGTPATRDSPRWRPLLRPAKPHYRFQLARQLSSLTTFLARQRYALLNFSHSTRDAAELPFAPEMAKLRTGSAKRVEPLSPRLWSHVQVVLSQAPAREQLMAHLMHSCGMSSTEVAELSCDAFVQVEPAVPPTAVQVTRGAHVVQLRLPPEVQTLVMKEVLSNEGRAVYGQLRHFYMPTPGAVLRIVARILRSAAWWAEQQGDVQVAHELAKVTPLSLRLSGRDYQTRRATFEGLNFVEEALLSSVLEATGDEAIAYASTYLASIFREDSSSGTAPGDVGSSSTNTD